MPFVPRRSFLGAAAACAVAICRPGAAAFSRSDLDVTCRASRYVSRYDQDLRAIVADGQYIQRSFPRFGEARDRPSAVRRLRSQIAWIHLPRLQDAIAIREVIDIDGHPTRGERKLRRLLEDPDVDVESEVTSLLDASAAHNLDSGSRNINFPTFPLVDLRERNLSRSRWWVDERDGTHLVLAFGERSSPTIVKSSEGDPLRATGRFRIDATSGRIEQCDLRVALDVEGLFLKRTPVAGADEMAVTFVPDAGVDLWVPSRMTDSFERGTGRDGVRITGEATYSNYRRFRTGGRLVVPVQK